MRSLPIHYARWPHHCGSASKEWFWSSKKVTHLNEHSKPSLVWDLPIHYARWLHHCGSASKEWSLSGTPLGHFRNTFGRPFGTLSGALSGHFQHKIVNFLESKSEEIWFHDGTVWFAWIWLCDRTNSRESHENQRIHCKNDGWELWRSVLKKKRDFLATLRSPFLVDQNHRPTDTG